MRWLLHLSTALAIFKYTDAESGIIVERWVNKSDVIGSEPFTTMTSCYMRCLKMVNCATVGFEIKPEKGKSENCTFLKTKGVAERRQSFMTMFLLLTADEFEEEIERRSDMTTKERESKLCQKDTLWKRIHLINTEQPITRNKLVTTLEKMTRQFVMHLEVKPTAFGAEEYSNIIHFTQSGNGNTYGDRTPAILFQKNTRTYSISSAVNGNVNLYFEPTEVYKLGVWSSIQVSQLKQNDNYNYSIRVNGKLKFSVINTHPGMFENVKVFASDNFYAHQPGFIRKLWVEIYQGED